MSFPVDAPDLERQSSAPAKEAKQQRRSTRVAVNGWVCLDKPVGLTSTQAVAQVKYLFNAKKAGHAGTLDPLASGVLPIALGEATKTVPIVQDGVKVYRFGVKWGEETDTDDAEGRVVDTFGSYGSEPGQFRLGHDIAVAPDGAVYVAEGAGARVQKFVRREK